MIKIAVLDDYQNAFERVIEIDQYADNHKSTIRRYERVLGLSKKSTIQQRNHL